MDIDKYLLENFPFEDEIKKYFGKNDELTIFEIGGCEGEDTVKLRRRFPNSKVYVFEPLPKNVKKIKKNISKYKITDALVHELALSNKTGKATFYVSSGQPDDAKSKDWDYGNKSSSLLAPKETKKIHKWLKFKEKIDVKTERIDVFCNKNNIDSIDFIYMDVQGAELMVLEGAGNYLEKCKMIWLEVEAVELYKDQPLRKEVESFMKRNGYTCIQNTVDTVAGDQLYVRKDKRKKKSLTKKAADVARAQAKRITSKLPTPESSKKVSYAQSGEDLIMQYLVDCTNINNPTYIDIGAHHPEYLNNTAVFYKKGFRGINIEPDPVLFKEFTKRRPNDTNLNIGIAKKKGVLDFYTISIPTLNTFSEAEAKNYEKAGYTIDGVTKIAVENINDVIKKHLGKAPAIMSLDIEGLDLEVLKSLDFKRYAPDILCVETITFSETGNGTKNQEIIDFTLKQGYMLYADTNINSIFIKKKLWVK